MVDQNKNKPVSKAAPAPPQKPAGLINQTGNRPGGTVTRSYKTIDEGRSKKK
jgi:hypothetical protein